MSEELTWVHIREGLIKRFDKLNLTVVVEKPKTIMVINVAEGLQPCYPSVRVLTKTKIAIMHGPNTIREEEVDMPAYTTSAISHERINEMIETARKRLTDLIDGLIRHYNTLNEVASSFDEIEVRTPEHDDP